MNEFYAGCNYWINQGKNEFEPLGTATSMHDCGDCEKLNLCILKKSAEVWEYDETVEKELQKEQTKINKLNLAFIENNKI